MRSLTQNELNAVADDFRNEGWEVPMARAFQARGEKAVVLPLLIVHAPGIDPGELKHAAEKDTERFGSSLMDALKKGAAP